MHHLDAVLRCLAAPPGIAQAAGKRMTADPAFSRGGSSDRQELTRALSLCRDRGIDIVDAIPCVRAGSAGDHLFTFDAGAA